MSERRFEFGDAARGRRGKALRAGGEAQPATRENAPAYAVAAKHDGVVSMPRATCRTARRQAHRAITASRRPSRHSGPAPYRLGLDSTIWYHARRALAEQYRVIVWDLAGSGLSTRPQDRNFSLEKMPATSAPSSNSPVTALPCSSGIASAA